MEQEKLVSKIRYKIGDNIEPYVVPDEQILDMAENAILDYSRHRPHKTKTMLNIHTGVSEYILPTDYQTWLNGLEGYEILDNMLYVDPAPLGDMQVIYNYIANHSIETFPEIGLPLLLDYVFYQYIDGLIKDSSDISSLDIGKNLKFKFDNVEQLTKEAQRCLDNYNKKVAVPSGGWV